MESFELASCHHAIAGYHENVIISMEGSLEGALLFFIPWFSGRFAVYFTIKIAWQKKLSKVHHSWIYHWNEWYDLTSLISLGFHHCHGNSCLRNDPGPGWVVKAHPAFLGDGNQPPTRNRNNPHPVIQPAVFLRLKPLGGFHPQKDLPKIFVVPLKRVKTPRDTVHQKYSIMGQYGKLVLVLKTDSYFTTPNHSKCNR